MEKFNTVVVGAGQAGLSSSYELSELGVEHIVLERDRIGAGWANRWESFCLVTPNWSVQLPGYPYDGDDPDGFMPRDDIVAYLERYAASCNVPVHLGANVNAVTKGTEGFDVVLADGRDIRCQNLIVSTGAYQKPFAPRGRDTLPEHLEVMDATGFISEASLPEGDVLIIGSGQTGCQLAEELQGAGRRVVLACGKAPWAPRRIGDHDLMWWLIESGFMDVDATTLPPEARLFANVLASGHQGGHDLHYRTLADKGIELTGRFLGAKDGVAQFAPDLADSIAWGDARYVQLREHFKRFASDRGLAMPDLADPTPFDLVGPESIDLHSFGSVIVTGGFRPDYLSWLPWPEAFDDAGFPLQRDGASTEVEGLYFVGLHFMRTRRSALLCGVGDDARVVAEQVAKK